MYYYCDGKDDEDDEDDDDHIKFLDSFFYCPSTHNKFRPLASN